MTNLPRNTILTGDAATVLRSLPSASVDCVITSPPYYQLRNYGVIGQLGLESTVDDWVEGLRKVFAEVARVLKPVGALWVNLGDSFSTHHRYGAPPKGLLLAPERLMLTLARDGWLVRNKVIWAKPNPMPSSVGDRLSLTYEVVYLLVRARRYWFDLDAIREPHRSRSARQTRLSVGPAPAWIGPLAGRHSGLQRARPAGLPGHVLGKNPGDVWTIATAGYHGAHFAVFPPALVRRPLLATCPERVCARCGAAWRDAQSACNCAAATVPGLVLDPFFGTGTVGVVAQELGRDWLGIELNPAFVRLAEQRLRQSARAAPVEQAA
jgi:site-specific DNA-methyltransferase (adenine-specific)